MPLPTDIRDLNWSEIEGLMHGPRKTIWEWLKSHGPATTSAIAEGTGIALLTVRPRVTELCQMEFAECVGRERREGVYQARKSYEAMARHVAGRNLQTEMEL